MIPALLLTLAMDSGRAAYWTGAVADMGTTHYALDHGATELNPAWQWADDDAGKIVAVNLALTFGLDQLLQRELRKADQEQDAWKRRKRRRTIKALRWFAGSLRFGVAVHNWQEVE